MNQKKPIIAVFDFDGTLTYRDTLLPFLFFTHGSKALLKLTGLLPDLTAYLLKMKSRQATKECILTTFYKGLPLEKLNELCHTYAATELDKKIRPEARERLKWHLREGHRVIIVSASIQNYIIPWAKIYHIEDVISSRPEVSPQGLVTGRLQGLNCWGPEKLRRLQEVIGNVTDYSIYAYGDSRGDKELLETAEYPYFRTFHDECCTCH